VIVKHETFRLTGTETEMEASGLMTTLFGVGSSANAWPGNSPWTELGTSSRST
jgi:hypothetical protein